MYCLKTENNYIYYEKGELYKLNKDIFFLKIRKKFKKIKIGIIKKRYGRFKFYILNIQKIDDLNILKNKNSGIYLIEFFDIVTIIKINEKFCLKCLKKRYIETLNFSVKKFINKNTAFIYNSYIDKIKISKLIKYCFKIKFERIIIFDKYKNKIYYLSEKEMIKCKDHIEVMHFDDIHLKDRMYKIFETGYRVYNNINIHIGRFMPIIDVKCKTNKDIIKLPIYSSEIAMYCEEEFAYHGGKGYSKYQAYKSAIGEAYERYCSKILGNEITKFDTYENLIKMNINTFNPFEVLNKENNNLNYSHKKVYEWCLVTDLTDNKKIYIPSNMIFFPYTRDNDYHMISQTTTGLACGNYIEEAILQAILEIVERDSYVIKYLENIPLPTIDLSTDKELYKISKYLKKMDIKLHIKHLNTKYGIHVVHCTTQSTKFPIFTHGAGAALDIKTAIRRAIIECIQLRISQIELRENYKEFNSKDNYSYKQWGLGEMKEVSPYLNNDITEILSINDFENFSTGNLKTDIQNIIKHLNKDNKKVYVANLTRKFYDLSVVRVIIPDMQDIDFYGDRETEKIKKLVKRNIFS